MKRLYASVTEDFHSTVKSRAARDGEDLTEWVRRAVADRLDPPGASKDTHLGPLADMPAQRRDSALRCIRFLKDCPEEFQNAIDDILKAVSALERRVCHRK